MQPAHTTFASAGARSQPKIRSLSRLLCVPGSLAAAVSSRPASTKRAAILVVDGVLDAAEGAPVGLERRGTFMARTAERHRGANWRQPEAKPKPKSGAATSRLGRYGPG